MGKSDNGDRQPVYIEVSGRVFQAVAASVFQAQCVECFTCIGDSGEAKVERVIIRETQYIKSRFFQILSIAGRHPKGVTADRLVRFRRAALFRFAAVGHRPLKVTESDIRGREKWCYFLEQIGAVIWRHSRVVRKRRTEHYVADGSDSDGVLYQRCWRCLHLCKA